MAVSRRAMIFPVHLKVVELYIGIIQVTNVNVSYTHAYPQLMATINNNGISWKVPALMLEPEEQMLLERVYEENKVCLRKYVPKFKPRQYILSRCNKIS